MNSLRLYLSLLIPAHVDKDALRSYIGKTKEDLADAFTSGTIPIKMSKLPKGIELADGICTDIDGYNEAKLTLLDEARAARKMNLTLAQKRRFDDIDPVEYAQYQKRLSECGNETA